MTKLIAGAVALVLVTGPININGFTNVNRAEAREETALPGELSLTLDTISREAGSIVVYGTITNNGIHNIDSISLSGTFCDSNQTEVQREDDVVVMDTLLPAGESCKFSFATQDNSSIATATVMVSGCSECTLETLIPKYMDLKAEYDRIVEQSASGTNATQVSVPPETDSDSSDHSLSLFDALFGGEEETEPAYYTPVSAGQLVDTLENNAMYAKDTYENQYLEVTGVLDNIDASGKYFTLDPVDSYFNFTNLQFFIDTDEVRQQVKYLNKNQKITVQAKCTRIGELLGYSFDAKHILQSIG